jgi:hypothetical protein
MFDLKRRFRDKGLETSIHVREQRLRDEVYQPAFHRRTFALPKKLVEHRNAPTWPEHTFGLLETPIRVRHHGNDQVHNDSVKGFVGELELASVHHVSANLPAASSRARLQTLEHRRRHIYGRGRDTGR